MSLLQEITNLSFFSFSPPKSFHSLLTDCFICFANYFMKFLRMFIIRSLRIPFVLRIISDKLQRRRAIISFREITVSAWISMEAWLQHCFLPKLSNSVNCLGVKSYCWELWEGRGLSWHLELSQMCSPTAVGESTVIFSQRTGGDFSFTTKL